LRVCKDLGVTPIGYSPLALGLLSGKYTGNPEVRGIDEAKDKKRIDYAELVVLPQQAHRTYMFSSAGTIDTMVRFCADGASVGTLN
jgi:aryl-alcohol dehydrogenase-like predicted oxidoreductase